MLRCRSCKVEILMPLTRKGKRMPVDVEPSAEGTVLVDGDQATILANDNLDAARRDGLPLRTSHHDTCPQGRRPRR